jgi:hypothetical protein
VGGQIIATAIQPDESIQLICAKPDRICRIFPIGYWFSSLGPNADSYASEESESPALRPPPACDVTMSNVTTLPPLWDPQSWNVAFTGKTDRGVEVRLSVGITLPQRRVMWLRSIWLCRAERSFGLIGEGGVAEVYRARDTRLDRIVVIKVSEHVDARRLGTLQFETRHSPELLDFGLAKNNFSARKHPKTLLTAPGVIAGTMRYMARTASGPDGGCPQRYLLAGFRRFDPAQYTPQP